MEPKKDKNKLPNAYDQSQDLDGGMSNWTYNMGELNTGTTVTTASTGSLDDGLDIKFDVSDGLYQSRFDFDDENNFTTKGESNDDSIVYLQDIL